MILIEQRSVYIPQIDGKDIWLSNYVTDNQDGYSLLDKNGSPNLNRYKATFDYSLDLIKLYEIYSKVYRNNRFCYKERHQNYCDRIINVTFRYSVKAFNRTGTNIYLASGFQHSDVEWSDCLGVHAGEVIAVKVGINTIYNAEQYALPSYFTYKNGQFHIKSNVKTLQTVSEIREKLYKDGFYCNGVHYIRFKRSSGSARVGKCLFIDENLYPRFHKWQTCGIKVRYRDELDLAAFESYISLTSSSIIGMVHIEPKNILLIDDYESVFVDNAINVFEQDGMLEVKHEDVQIKNSIWDGQSLIDSSIMGIYQGKGMVLLRNRFFKSCAFNCNIQKWLADHGITDVSQLNGKTTAIEINDIKLITTPSSIKYLKFSTYDKWLEYLEPDFGVVKYEKSPHSLDGKLVQTHYQLLNSIQFTKEEMQDFMAPTFEFINLIRVNSSVLRYWIKFHIENEIEITPIKSKNDVIYKMMSINQDFYKTKLYYDFVKDFVNSFVKNLRCGHVFVNGNYSVLCGNPIEMLMQSIGEFKGERIADEGCLYSTRFPFGKKLLGSRSPHISMSNVLLTENRDNPMINQYMNSSDTIVYINSIGENILQKLAGCDFDSDTILLTDNEILVRAASKNYGRFPVAVCNVEGTKKRRRYTPEDLADLDIKTSNNLIGDIVNLSQELNSDIWDSLAHGATYEDIEREYLDVCKLSIMSGIEIDKAKKEFVIDNANELKKIRKRWHKEKNGKSVRPYFFAHIARLKGYYNPRRKAYLRHRTSMDYLQEYVNLFRAKDKKKCGPRSFLPFSSVVNRRSFSYKHVDENKLHQVLGMVDRLGNQLKAIYVDQTDDASEKHLEATIVRQKFMEEIGNMKFSKDLMIALLLEIEKPENKARTRLLFYTLFGYPNRSFYDVIKNSKDKIREIVADDNGDIIIYGYNFY